VYTYITYRGGEMTDQPPPTEHEEERAPEELEDHEAMRQAGHENPPDIAQDDEEIHDA
jgi:hypothetical protein